MEISGEMHLAVSLGLAFSGLLDPGVLSRSIPGLKSFTALGEGRYQLVTELGVAGVGGRYQGTLEVVEAKPPESMRLVLELTGGPGSVSATIAVTLAADNAGSELSYQGQSEVGGKLAGIGQRLLDGVARTLERQFMARLSTELAGWVRDRDQGRTSS